MMVIVSRKRIIEILLYIILFIFLLTTSSEAYNIVKIYIDVRITYIAIFSLLLIVFLTLLNSVRIDLISCLLILRIFIFTITLMLFNNSVDMMPRYLAVIVSFVSYSVFYNINFKSDSLLKYVKVAFVIISIQTIIASFNALGMSDVINYIKVYIRIPIGGSNYIASILIMLLPIIWFNEKNKKSKYLITLLGITAIIMCRSNMGLLLIGIFIILVTFQNRQFKSILNGIIILFSLIGTIWVINLFNNDFFNRYINAFTKLFSSDWALAFNGRIDLFVGSINLIKNNFIIGLGINYVEHLGALAHNIILESLLQAGIFNTLILFFILFIIIRKTFKYRRLSECLAVNVSVILVLINGMVEPNLFSFSFDYFFWAICGFGMSMCKRNQESNNDMH